MTKIKTSFNRRSFLKVSAAAGGGMAIGFSWLVSCTPQSQEDVLANTITPPDEWFKINGFLKIGDNGVTTIMSPNPEIGQNVKTAMPMIVAEELDIDWANVIVEQAPLNTQAFRRQIAGGSQSIRQSWEGLRMAGATAKAMLVSAAAQQMEVPAEELSVSKGKITHEASGKSLGYGEVASLAASMEVPEEVELKNPKDFTIIGTPTKNVDGLDIVTGKPLFGLDVDREGMLLAMIEHPPAFGMKAKSFNEAEIKAMPGVKDAFIVSSDPGEGNRGWTYANNAFPQLVTIVGETTWQLMKAKKALKVEWETFGTLESTADHEISLEKTLGLPIEEPDRKDGDPNAAFASAAQVIERTYQAPFLAHNTMEPMNFFAHVMEDKAELEGPIQTPEPLREAASKLLGLPAENIHVMMTRMGGGFGRRLYGNFGMEAAAISQRMKAPIKLIYTREDDMTQGTYRPDYKVTYRAGLDENNQLVAFEVKGVGTDGGPIFADRFPAGAVDNYHAENRTKESSISTGAWRAPRSNFIAGAEQAFLDEVAEAAGKDPIEFRLELFDRAQNNPVGEDNDYDAARYAGVLKLVKEKANWGTETPGIYRGVAAYYCHNSYVAQVVDVAIENDVPKVKKVWCAVDCGIVVNPEGAINQIEGGIIDGIGHAMYSGLTFNEGRPEQSNFDKYRLIRHTEAPEAIEAFFVDNGINPTGLGEPSLPPVIGALANALANATGKRYYKQPFVQEMEVLG
ncbi:MAG TPA: molybdopterin cofactor-binding domain-containing protein [Saprospiraceae bacterium]|nr:molybdopterin cofactor-binding domain-containing protein [Saprospiraceae bacterium]